MRKMVPSESFKQIEVQDFTYSLSDFNKGSGDYYYVLLNISHIPNDAIVMCRQEIEITSLADTDLRNDVLSKIYIDDTRKDDPNSVTIYLLNATLPDPDMNMTFRLYIFYKPML